MALSNIFVEPRREITETVVGLGTSIIPIGLYGWATYAIALTIEGNEPFTLKLFLAAVILAFGLIIVIAATAGFFMLTHAIGDGVCNALEKRGFQLRPRQRYIRTRDGKITSLVCN